MIKSELEEIGSSQEKALISQFLENDSNRPLEPLRVEEISSISIEQTVEPEEKPENNVDAVALPSISDLPFDNWKGIYNFDVHFESNKVLKGVKYIFSSANNKLYVDKDFPCPISFFVTDAVPPDVFIRLQLFFSQAHNYELTPTRCINHSIAAANAGVCHPYHFITCESDNTIYETSPMNRQSILVPFQKPIEGLYVLTPIFKFTCYTSCSGGINRRPVTLVITLEKGGSVFGKRSFALKVCACPARDYKNDLKALHENEQVKQTLDSDRNEMTIKSLSSHLSVLYNFVDDIMSDKEKCKASKGPFTVTVESHEDYVALKRMYSVYKCSKLLKDPNLPQILRSIKKIKKQETTTTSED